MGTRRTTCCLIVWFYLCLLDTLKCKVKIRVGHRFSVAWNKCIIFRILIWWGSIAIFIQICVMEFLIRQWTTHGNPRGHVRAYLSTRMKLATAEWVIIYRYLRPCKCMCVCVYVFVYSLVSRSLYMHLYLLVHVLICAKLTNFLSFNTVPDALVMRSEAVFVLAWPPSVTTAVDDAVWRVNKILTAEIRSDFCKRTILLTFSVVRFIAVFNVYTFT